jgi:uncharacterized protein YoaH (UPF0181 family)
MAQKTAARGDSSSRFKGFIRAIYEIDVYLGRRGAPPQSREILGTLRNILFDARRKIERGSKAGGIKPVEETQRMALAAAIVTELMRRKMSSDEAIAKVATAGGIDKKKLRGFRDNINRGLKDPDALKFYKVYTTEFAKKDTGEAVMLELLNHPH